MNPNIGGVTNRKKSALQRLENQLIKGTRTPKGVAKIGLKYVSWEDNKPIPLTESDISRIKKEIETLKSRI